MKKAPWILCASLAASACTPATLPSLTPADAQLPGDAPAAADVQTPSDLAVLDDAPAVVDAGRDVPILDDVPLDVASTRCTRASECAAPFSVCDVVNARCVQCLSAAQCGAGQVCIANRCAAARSCMSARTCEGLVCDAARGVCVECLTEVDCPMGQECRAQSCVAPPPPCMSSRQCSIFDRVCDTARGVCVECVDDRDCPMDRICDAQSACAPRACAPGAARCVSGARVAVCDARGAGETERDCGADEVCAREACRARVCAPGAVSCASSTMTQTCASDGLGYTPGSTCPAGQSCSQGVCSACDADGDGDDDGLSDADERTRGTNPCARDSDGDGASDLVERLAGTNPLVRGSVPAGLVVELPFSAAATERRELAVSAARRALDVMFLIDSTGSMQTAISELQRNAATMTSTILSAIGPGADVRFGVADFRDFGTESMARSEDYAVAIRAPLSRDVTAFSAGLGRLTIGNGGDAAEALVPALYALVEGPAFPAYRGAITRAATAADCGNDNRSIGWACHLAERLAVFVAYSDAAWHNPPGQAGNFYRSSAPDAPVYGDLVRAMRRRDARYVGVEVGTSTRHLVPSIELARDTDSFDSTGSPTVYQGSPTGTLPRLASTLAGLTAGGRPDYFARAAADPSATGLPPGRSGAEFVRSVLALRGAPDAPAGYMRREGSTFYSVALGTSLTWELSLRNDFVAQGAADQVFPAAIVVTAAGYPTKRVPLWIVVPAR